MRSPSSRHTLSSLPPCSLHARSTGLFAPPTLSLPAHGSKAQALYALSMGEAERGGCEQAAQIAAAEKIKAQAVNTQPRQTVIYPYIMQVCAARPRSQRHGSLMWIMMIPRRRKSKHRWAGRCCGDGSNA
eukprot:799383-Rhodomonas_salina.1